MQPDDQRPAGARTLSLPLGGEQHRHGGRGARRRRSLARAAVSELAFVKSQHQEVLASAAPAPATPPWWTYDRD
jgi:hypothetical protein